MQNTLKPTDKEGGEKEKRCFLFLKYISNGFNKEKSIRLLKLSALVVALFVTFIAFIYLYVFYAPAIGGVFVKKATVNKQTQNDSVTKQLTLLEKELNTLKTKYISLTPKQPYLVINTTDNHFFLYKNRELIREGFVSTGSYIRLRSEDNREWLFKTPKGKRTVKGKMTNPVWRKPDWAFVEEGLPVPSANHPSRYEAGVLGDYALSLGDGYLIHGTLYKRFLGMPVTHGCIRMNDEDLEFIFKSLNTGSHVYIY
ncbi:MAG TPA: L,D-transpeptidase [Bacteroidales bacterium]|jgi:lipoprotein-anchoring transpeptidase ErfK/SrfK|nr:L,D-transpeptidase [Bacteroidales bacterium]